MKNELEYFQEQAKQAWKNFIYGDVDKPELPIRPEILTAWKRCRRMNVNPETSFLDTITDKNDISRKLQNNQDLLSVSVPAIHYLYQFMQNAQLFVAVSDADGCLLKVYGNTEILGNDILYSLWSEKAMGNNPIGTSLVEDRPVQVRGFEHYCKYPHHFSGSGTPIHDPEGNIVGAISITNTAMQLHPYTLPLIVMTAYSIEEQLNLKQAHRNVDQAFTHTKNILNSISEGLIVLNTDGFITMINNFLLEKLNISEDNLLNHSITEFIPEPILEHALKTHSPFTDFVSKIQIGNINFSCTITCRIIEQSPNPGIVLIINELSRIRKLVEKLSDTQTANTFDSIIGPSVITRNLVEEAKAIASNDSNILLLGESGTGKDIFAQAIHNGSPRRNGPFIPINCGAVQKELIMSELFGYEDGAFTGARRGGAVGKLEYANGGTIFLDEIGEMPLELQPTLLRAIEQRTITRVGGKKFIPIDVRIIAATNRNLEGEVEKGTFRQDLFYRLNVFSLTLPSLKERAEDIPALANNFVIKMDIKYGKNITDIDPEAMTLMKNYPWPGNIRELQNCMERCVALARSSVITPDLLPSAILRYQPLANQFTADHCNPNQAAPASFDDSPGDICTPFSSYPDAASVHAAFDTPAPFSAASGITPSATVNSRDELLQLLNNCYWNISQVSRILGVTRATVYRRMKKYGISNKHPI